MDGVNILLGDEYISVMSDFPMINPNNYGTNLSVYEES